MDHNKEGILLPAGGLSLPPQHDGNRIFLRDYQMQLIVAIYQQWEYHRCVMAQLPTGGGKTIIFSAIACEFLRRNEKVLIVAHREELILQAAAKVRAFATLEPSIIKAGYRPDYDQPLQVASVQSLVNRLDALETVGLLIVDEAHHATAATYRKILEAFPNAYVLGVTATPVRTDGTGFRDLFGALVTGPSVRELIDGGYLCRFRLFADPDPMKTKGARTVSGDFSASDLAQLNDIVELSGNLLRSYCTHAWGKRCVVFAVNVEHSRAIAARYQAAGIPAAHLDGTTPDDQRRDALARFRRGELLVLSNCQLFDEGLDIPALEAVQVAKPTKSLTRWLQMVGRSLRVGEGKSHAIILDHTQNWAIHGLPTRPRQWTLDGVEPQHKTRAKRDPDTGEVIEVEVIEEAVELCEIQEDEVPVAHETGAPQSTPEEAQVAAGHAGATQFTEQAQVPDNANGTRLTEQAQVPNSNVGATQFTEEELWQQVFEELLRIQQQRGYKIGWIYYRLLDLKPPLAVWKQYARLRGYKPGWAIIRWQEQQQAIAQP